MVARDLSSVASTIPDDVVRSTDYKVSTVTMATIENLSL